MIAPTVGWLALLLPLALAPNTPTSTETGEPVALNGRVVELTAAPRSSGLGFDEDRPLLPGADGAPDAAGRPMNFGEAPSALAGTPPWSHAWPSPG